MIFLVFFTPTLNAVLCKIAAIVEAITIQSKWLYKLIISFRSLLFLLSLFDRRMNEKKIINLVFCHEQTKTSPKKRGFWLKMRRDFEVWVKWWNKVYVFSCPLFINLQENENEKKNLLCSVCALNDPKRSKISNTEIFRWRKLWKFTNKTTIFLRR